MGLLEQMTHGAFVGEEFLTWLWHLSETLREPVAVPKIGAVQIASAAEGLAAGLADT